MWPALGSKVRGERRSHHWEPAAGSPFCPVSRRGACPGWRGVVRRRFYKDLTSAQTTAPSAALHAVRTSPHPGRGDLRGEGHAAVTPAPVRPKGKSLNPPLRQTSPPEQGCASTSCPRPFRGPFLPPVYNTWTSTVSIGPCEHRSRRSRCHRGTLSTARALSSRGPRGPAKTLAVQSEPPRPGQAGPPWPPRNRCGAAAVRAAVTYGGSYPGPPGPLGRSGHTEAVTQGRSVTVCKLTSSSPWPLGPASGPSRLLHRIIYRPRSKDTNASGPHAQAVTCAGASPALEIHREHQTVVFPVPTRALCVCVCVCV